MGNEIAINNHLRTNQNRLTLGNRTDLNCNYDRGGDTKIHTHEIINEIRKLKNKAPGISGINRHILINCPKNIIYSIKNIFNASLSIGYFPDQFKVAKNIPVPKPGKDSKQIENYRPISLLEVPGKILEKILSKRLQRHLHLHNQLNPNQHGFIKNRGTHTAIALATETISKATKNKNRINLVLRDVKGAFDKVWCDGLKNRILELNLSPNLTKILCNFISNRQTIIEWKGKSSSTFELKAGVPQGPILSPTLYNIYIAP